MKRFVQILKPVGILEASVRTPFESCARTTNKARSDAEETVSAEPEIDNHEIAPFRLNCTLRFAHHGGITYGCYGAATDSSQQYRPGDDTKSP